MASVSIVWLAPELLVTVTSPLVSSPGKKLGFSKSGLGLKTTSKGVWAKAVPTKPPIIVIMAIGNINFLRKFFIVLFLFRRCRCLLHWSGGGAPSPVEPAPAPAE